MLRSQVTKCCNEFFAKIFTYILLKTPSFCNPFQKVAVFDVGHSNDVGYFLLLILPFEFNITDWLNYWNNSFTFQPFWYANFMLKDPTLCLAIVIDFQGIILAMLEC